MAIEQGCADYAPDVARFVVRHRWLRLILRRTGRVVARLRQRKRRGASHRIVRVSVPFALEQDVGLDDALKRLTSKLGIELCPACQERGGVEPLRRLHRAEARRAVIAGGRPSPPLGRRARRAPHSDSAER